ncbi:site-specific integrase, partial [Anabaena catenula FACHB-362]|nr:site-specific integrase [Anabaena catenula FACHB-362]
MDITNVEVSPVEILPPSSSKVVSRDTAQPVTAELVEEVIRQYYYR